MIHTMKSMHILGICGAFMGGLALIARALGYQVSGSDQNVYPPMSDLLRDQGIVLCQGYAPSHLQPAPDLILIGNVLSRGNPAVEYVLDQRLPFMSGCEWLWQAVLRERHVLAVSGTHGKTTTASMLAWILEHAGRQPGYLVGGVMENFGVSARLGQSRYFVIEADEYDTAFFDKRSKFVHYHPQTLVINNIEYDHADIFDDIEAIRRQFHHLLRVVPRSGSVIFRAGDENIQQVLARGCWSNSMAFALMDEAQEADWELKGLCRDFSRIRIRHAGRQLQCETRLLGQHNALNALAAMAAAADVGIAPELAAAALAGFRGVRRRLQFLGERRGVQVYDDFAHHPSAIAATLQALRAHANGSRIIAVMEPRSNTMKLGRHRSGLASAFADADQVLFYQPATLGWDIASATAELAAKHRVLEDIDHMVQLLVAESVAGDCIVFMSNGGFGGIQRKFMDQLT